MATVPYVTAWAGRTKYHADGFLFHWVYINPDAGGCKFLQNVWNYLPLNMTYPNRTQSPLTPLWELKILGSEFSFNHHTQDDFGYKF